MKQIFTILIFLGMVFTIYAQDFETGKIAISLSDAGRVRVSAPNFEKQQIDRSSLLFGVSKNEVFSYNSDADSMIAAITVESPLLSDFELTGIADNSYSDLPPDVENEIHVYGWQDEGFVIVKMSLKNLESSTINGIFGLEILPRVDGDYGSEVVESNDRVYTTYRPTTIISPTTTYTTHHQKSTR